MVLIGGGEDFFNRREKYTPQNTKRARQCFRMLRAIRFPAAWLLICAAAQAQTAVPPFEAVSIRPHEGSMRTLDPQISGPRLSWEAANLLMLVTFAYNVKNYQVTGAVPLLTGPDRRFTILAKAEGESARTLDEFRQMMRLMLAERFALRAHREMRETPVYALLVAKSGLKLKPSAPDAANTTSYYSFAGTNNSVTCAKANMEAVLAAVASGVRDRPVLDRTGLSGTYNLRLVFTPERRMTNPSEPGPEDIGIFTAVQEQLGLKLEPRREPMEMLVVDRAEIPTAN